MGNGGTPTVALGHSKRREGRESVETPCHERCCLFFSPQRCCRHRTMAGQGPNVWKDTVPARGDVPLGWRRDIDRLTFRRG